MRKKIFLQVCLDEQRKIIKDYFPILLYTKKNNNKSWIIWKGKIEVRLVRAHLVQGSLSFHNLVLSFHNSNSKPITHNPNPTVTQKTQHFCLITKLSHISQFLTPLFVKMMDRNTLTLHRRLWLPLASLYFSTLQTQLHRNPAQPPPTTNPESTTINQAPPPPTTNLEIHNLHHQTALNTTTTSTKKSE